MGRRQVKITLPGGKILDLRKWPLPAGVTDGVLNRAQLCAVFDVNDTTMTKWVRLGLPVKAAGTNGQAYEFQLSHAWAWKQERDDALRRRKDEADGLASAAAAAFRNLDEDEAEREPSMSANEVRAWAEAEFHRNRVAEQRGSLVRADRMQALLEDVLVAFRTAVTTLPDWAEMQFGLSAAQVDLMQGRCDDILNAARVQIERGLKAKGAIVALDEASGG